VTPDQHPVEIIMARGFMSNLATPAFLVDIDGTLVFFNEAAAIVLGVQFEEAGPMPADEWGTRFEPRAADGRELAPEELPLSIALAQARPAHGILRIRQPGGDYRMIEVAAFPIVGRGGQTGAMAIFWDDSG
jgi:PAS domain-containing protein